MNIKEKAITRVLVGIDFSDGSRCALTESIRLANQQKGEVHALHIIEESMIEAIEKYSKLNPDEILASVSSRLKAFCHECIGKNEDINFEVKIGHPVSDFSDASKRINPDLVVLGAWGSQCHVNPSTGVTVNQIIEESQSDVLLMRPREDKSLNGFSRVLACIDFSDYDIPIIRAADQLCLADGGSLEVLHVFYPPWKRGQPEDDAMLESSDFESEYKAVLQGRLDSLVPMNIHGVPTFETTTTVVEHLEHCEGILHHLKTTGSDVAVIGARGQGKIESMILGRIAERIVTGSPCSVYIVKNLTSSDKED